MSPQVHQLLPLGLVIGFRRNVPLSSGAAPLHDFSQSIAPNRTQRSWPAHCPSRAPQTPATAPTTQRLCQLSPRQTPGTNGAKRWTFFCLSSVLRWIWETFGDFLTFAIKTEAVRLFCDVILPNTIFKLLLISQLLFNII